MTVPDALIVEANATVRKVMSEALLRAGYTLRAAPDPAAAVETLASVTPKLILIDLHTLASDDRSGQLQMLMSKAPLSTWALMHPEHNSYGTHPAVVQLVSSAPHLKLLAFAKPFSPTELLRFVRDHVGEPTTSVRSTMPDTDKRERAAKTTHREPSGQPQRHVDAWLTRLARDLVPALNARPSDQPLTTSSFTQLLRDKLGPSALIALSHDLRQLAASNRQPPSLEGRIEHTPLVETLQMLHMQGQTGTVHIRDGDRVISVCLRQGEVDMAVAEGSLPEYLLGRYFINEGLISQSELEQLVSDAPRELEQLIGARLLAKNVISPEQLQETLARQTTDLLCEALRWQKGTFRFERQNLLPEAELAKLSLPIQSLLLENARRMDESERDRSEERD